MLIGLIEREKKEKKKAEHKANEWGIEIVSGGVKEETASSKVKVE